MTKGEIEVDVNGKKLYPIVVLRNYKDGTSVVHEIADIKRTTIGSNEPVRWDNFRKNSGSQSPNNSSIAQNGANVPAQEKSRLSGESSVSDTTDSLRALSRSGEIGNNPILKQDSENVNDYDSALVQPNNPEIRQTVCCVLVLPESNYDIIRVFKVIIQYR